MLAGQHLKTRQELIDEIRRVNRNVSRRLERIERTPNVTQFSLYKYRELDLTDLHKKTTTQLRELYRDLTYISSLRSSSVKGARIAYEGYFKEIDPYVKNLSEREKKIFWAVFDKAMFKASEYASPDVLNTYKYESIENYVNYFNDPKFQNMISGLNLDQLSDEEREEVVSNLSEEIARMIKSSYDVVYSQMQGRGITKDDRSVRFSSELRRRISPEPEEE